MEKIQVAIIVGSDSDLPSVAAAAKSLDDFAVPYRIHIASAHRSPEHVRTCVQQAEADGARVFIAAAGMAAALPGVVAAETVCPVIGVPMEGKTLAGMDALFSIAQMPPAIPVATVAIGKAGATNAGILAVEILSVGAAELKTKLGEYRKKLAATVTAKDAELQKNGLATYIEKMNSGKK